MREALPNRRAGEHFEFFYRNALYAVTVGFYDDGRPAEVFVNMEKLGTGPDSDARDIAILISFALQHGVSLEVLCRAMTREGTGEASGLGGEILDQVTRFLEGRQ